ncbi:PDZ domain-containing protein [Streptomyces murinus]
MDAVRTGSPAQAGGLRAGDRIFAVDGNLVPTPGSRSRPSAPDGPDPPSSSPSGATAGVSTCPSGWPPASLGLLPADSADLASAAQVAHAEPAYAFRPRTSRGRSHRAGGVGRRG